MDIIENLVAPISVLAGVAWILRAYIRKSFDKDIERYRKELEIENHKVSERFSFVYQKKSLVFEATFEKAMEAASRTTHAITRDRPDKRDIIIKELTEAARKVSDYGRYKNSKALFFQSKVNEKAAKVHQLLGRALEHFADESDAIVTYEEIESPNKWDDMVGQYNNDFGIAIESLREAIHDDLEM